jgi:hypothetical protein
MTVGSAACAWTIDRATACSRLHTCMTNFPSAPKRNAKRRTATACSTALSARCPRTLCKTDSNVPNASRFVTAPPAAALEPAIPSSLRGSEHERVLDTVLDELPSAAVSNGRGISWDSIRVCWGRGLGVRCSWVLRTFVIAKSRVL